MGPKRLVLTLAIRLLFFFFYFVQLRIAKVENADFAVPSSAPDLDKPVVDPVFHEFFAGKRLGLRDCVS